MSLVQINEEELRELIERVVEQKLLEWLGDPEEDWPLREEIRERLLRQREAVRQGDRGKPLEEVLHRLGLDKG